MPDHALRPPSVRDSTIGDRRQTRMRNVAVVAGTAALLLLAAVPAHAQDAWGSIAVGETHRGDAVAYAVAWNHDTRAGAREAAMGACLSGGGTDCSELAWFQNGCGALALDQYGIFAGTGGVSREQAEARALQTCETKGGSGCTLAGSACASAGEEARTWSGSESVLASPAEEKADLTVEGTADMEDPARAGAALEEALPGEVRVLIQQGLAALGFAVGPADGLFGPRTRAAIGEWQSAEGSDATGYLTVEEVAALAALGRAASQATAEGEPRTGQEENPGDGGGAIVEPEPEDSRNRVLYFPECSNEVTEECWTFLSDRPECSVWLLGGLNLEFAVNDQDIALEQSRLTWSGSCLHNAAHGGGTLRQDYASHGPVTDVYEESAGRMIGGKRNGQWSGSLRLQQTDGVAYTFEREGPFVDGKQNGRWIERAWASYGDSVLDENVSEGSYVDGKRHGHWVVRHLDETVTRTHFIDGEPQ